MRTITLTGHIVADAELKISKTGRQYLSFRLGNNESLDKDASGNQKTYWFSVTSLNQRHFNMTPYLTKGKPVIVVGDYNDRLYQNREGNCEIGRDILANGIYFVDGNGSTKNASQNKPVSNPVTQTTMQPKPTTSELKVPNQSVTVSSNASDDSEDDLPF